MKTSLATFIIFIFLHTNAYSSVDTDFLVVVASPLEVKKTDIKYKELVNAEHLEILGIDKAVRLKYLVDEVIFGNVQVKEKIVFYDRDYPIRLPNYVAEPFIYLFLVKIDNKYILSTYGVIKETEDEDYLCGENLNPFNDESHWEEKHKKTIHECDEAYIFDDFKKHLSTFDFAGNRYEIQDFISDNIN